MPSLNRKNLQEAVKLSAQSSECLKKTYSVILDSVGNANNYDDNSFLAQCLSNIGECNEKMNVVSGALAEVWGCSKPALSLSQSKASKRKETVDYDTPFDDRYLRKAVSQSRLAYENLVEVYGLVLDCLGSAGSRDDNELLYQNLKIVEECKEKLRMVSSKIAAINESLEQCELEILYGPPPFFEND